MHGTQSQSQPDADAGRRVFRSVDWAAEGDLLAAGRQCFEALAAAGWLDAAGPSFEAFARRLEDAQAMRVPITAFTPMACWWLYELGWRHGGRRLVGAGTYCALGWSFLVAGAADRASAEVSAVALDIDPHATAMARANLARSGFRGAVKAVTAEATRWLAASKSPLDLLFLDLDDPVAGKAGYRAAFLAAAPRMAPGACLVAHDGCCPRFADDLAALAAAVAATPGWSAPLLLPVDPAGLLVAFRHRGGTQGFAPTTSPTST